MNQYLYCVDREWKEEELPPIEKAWTAREISQKVYALNLKLLINFFFSKNHSYFTKVTYLSFKLISDQYAPEDCSQPEKETG